MAWWDFRKRRKSSEEKRMEDLRIFVEAKIKELNVVCNEARVILEKRSSYTKNKENKELMGWVLDIFKKILHNLDDAYRFIHEDNSTSTKNELEEAENEINKDDIDDRIDYLIKSKIVGKDLKSKMLEVRSNIRLLLKNLK